MTKRSKLIAVAAGAVFLISAALSVWLLYPSERQMIEIVQDGTVLYSIDLAHTEDRSIRVNASDGGYNLVVIENGTVRIEDADCPDLTCVHMGALKSEHMPLVCLPHHLIVRFAEEDGA